MSDTAALALLIASFVTLFALIVVGTMVDASAHDRRTQHDSENGTQPDGNVGQFHEVN